MATELIRLCPKCGIEIRYKDKQRLRQAEKRNSKCITCAPCGRHLNGVYERLCECGKKITYKNHKHLWWANKFNGHCRECVCIIQRRNKIKRVMGTNGHFISNKCCDYIDKLNEEKGWNLQHARNGGEVEFFGYSLDGYDKDRNIIFEYDESHHEYAPQKAKDIERQDYLIDKVKPTLFLRYSEKHNRIYNILTANN